MKSASKLLRYLVLPLFLFNCGSTNVETSNLTPNQKAYVLLRSEGSEIEINRLSGILNSDFNSQDLQSNIIYYPPGKQWDINEIFSNSYENNYNYIVLIDQVAKFTIDGKTNVGGKYQIRSYNIKSTNPDWIDLGQKTCNVSVKESVNKFSQQIVNAVLPLNTVNNSLAMANETNSGSKITGIDYNQLKTSSEYDSQIAELQKQLENEKMKTDEAIAKKERLSREYQDRLKAKKEQNKSIVVGLEDLRKEMEVKEKLKQEEQEAKALEAEAKRLEELKLAEQKELERVAAAQAKEQEQKKREAEKLAEAERVEALKLEELKRKEQEALARTKQQEKKRLEKEKLAEAKRIEELELVEQKEMELIAAAQAKEQEQKKREAEKLAEAEQVKALKLEELKRKDEEKAAKVKDRERIKLEREKLVETKRIEALKLLDQKEKELKAIAEAKELKRQKRKAEKLADTNNKESIVKAKEREKGKLAQEKAYDVFLVISGKKTDNKGLGDLRDYIEFDLLFANKKTNSVIFNEDTVINKENFLEWNKEKFKYLILIEQLQSSEDSTGLYKLSTFKEFDSNWSVIDDLSYNIYEKSSLKEFSKKVLNSIK